MSTDQRGRFTSAAGAALPYKALMQSVLTTATFERQAKAAGLEDDEINEMISYLAANPKAGALMRQTGGARKVRFEGNEGGKSGGYRTIHYFGGDDVPVFLLGLIDKSGKKENLTAAQKKELADTLPQIADAYRAAAARKATGMKRGGK